MCTLEKHGNVFVLTLTGEDQHRLNPSLIDAILSVLNRVRSDPSSTSSSALITRSEGKFFSNGYDLAWARSSPDRLRLMSSRFRALVTELISFPMPTIAAITGHASAAGFILALSHDYAVMRRDRGILYMSEMDIGLKIPTCFVALIRNKIRSSTTQRDVILKAAKMTAKEAVERKIIDGAYESAEETVTAAISMGEELAKRGWNGQVYGENRMVLLKDVIENFRVEETTEDVNMILSKI